MQLLGSPPPERRIIRLVGTGGMGVVYEAWDTRLDRRVALKVLHPHLTMDGATRGRLLEEARLAARVEHEGVVRIYTIHEHDGGVCLEMQFVEGIPLNRMLSLRTLSPTHGADLLRQILEALIACHARNVIHCDLKPGNLLVTPEGKVMLADFGISRATYAEGDVGLPTTTLSGPMWGTPQYSPPEAWEGTPPTPSWDLYALGVVVHEAMTGALPFKAQTHAMLMREKLSGRTISITERRSDLSRELATLIDSLQSTDALARPESAEVARELLRHAPELLNGATATQPFRHNEQTSHQGELVPQEIVPLTSGAAAGAQKRHARSSWPIHLGWLLILLFSCAFFYARNGTETNAEPIASATPVVAPLGDPGTVQDLFVHNEMAYFSYDNGQRGRELWIADSVGQARMLADINPGKGSSNPGPFFPRPFGGIMFAATSAENGREPWYCGADSDHSTYLLRDIIPGPMSSDPEPVAAWEYIFLFYASSLQHGRELWVTNTNDRQTGLLRDLYPGTQGGPPSKGSIRCQDNTGAYFVQSTSSDGLHLWRYEFSDGSFQQLGLVNDEIGEMSVLGRTLIFSMVVTEYGNELWTYNPDVGEILLLKDIIPGNQSADPQQFFVWEDALYFQAETLAHGKELWKTDGTLDGTVEVADIFPGARGSAPYGFVATQDHLFFRAECLTAGSELWSTDGAVGQMPRVFDLEPGPESAHPYSLAVIGDFLFFSAKDGAVGEELWALNLRELALPPTIVQDIWPGPESSEPHNLTPMGEGAGIFVYKTPSGDALMRLEVNEDKIQLKPYSGLDLATDTDQ